jgi:hypothetical protein
MHHLFMDEAQQPGLVRFPDFIDCPYGLAIKYFLSTARQQFSPPRVRATHVTCGTCRVQFTMIAEAPMTFETEGVISQEPEISDLVPSEASASPILEPAGGASFPKVLRSRLDSFFSNQNISPKADLRMLDCSVCAQARSMEICCPLPFRRSRADIPFVEHRP